MDHKGNWPESTWTGHQGPTLAVISPRGTICETNTLIKTMCARVCARANQFRASVNIWQQKCFSVNQSDMLFVILVTCTHVTVYLRTSLQMCMCVWKGVYVSIWIYVGASVFNYPTHVTPPSLPPCFSFTERAPERTNVGK